MGMKEPVPEAASSILLPLSCQVADLASDACGMGRLVLRGMVTICLEFGVLSTLLCSCAVLVGDAVPVPPLHFFLSGPVFLDCKIIFFLIFFVVSD